MSFQNGQGRKIAAKAPAENADAGFINPLLLAKPACDFDCILAFHPTKILIGHLFEMGATAAGTTAIETSHHIAMLCKHVEPIIVTIAIAICHLLVTRATIYIEEQWIALGGIKVRRENNIVVQLCTQ